MKLVSSPATMPPGPKPTSGRAQVTTTGAATIVAPMPAAVVTLGFFFTNVCAYNANIDVRYHLLNDKGPSGR